MRVRLLPIFLGVAAALLVMGAAATGSQPTARTADALGKGHPATVLRRSRDLWATVNVCDTAKHPNTIGIRGSMPGLGSRRTTLQMRFQVQYKAKDGKWHNTDSSADSGYKTVGRTRTKVRESGQDFKFLPPGGGGAFTLRGSIRFRWLSHGRTVRRARRLSEAGHRSTAGADPVGYSAARCQITQP